LYGDGNEYIPSTRFETEDEHPQIISVYEDGCIKTNIRAVSKVQVRWEGDQASNVMIRNRWEINFSIEPYLVPSIWFWFFFIIVLGTWPFQMIYGCFTR
jgi:hypothetical protein